jgi:hypothetical protein
MTVGKLKRKKLVQGLRRNPFQVFDRVYDEVDTEIYEQAWKEIVTLDRSVGTVYTQIESTFKLI